jgi:hypothetical protein
MVMPVYQSGALRCTKIALIFTIHVIFSAGGYVTALRAPPPKYFYTFNKIFTLQLHFISNAILPLHQFS